MSVTADYIIESIRNLAKKSKIITLPIDACPQKYITVSTQGLTPIKVSIEDDSLHIALCILSYSLKGIYASYGKDYCLTEPHIIYRSNCVELKIGMLEKKLWKEIKQKKKLRKGVEALPK